MGFQAIYPAMRTADKRVGQRRRTVEVALPAPQAAAMRPRSGLAVVAPMLPSVVDPGIDQRSFHGPRPVWCRPTSSRIEP